jgi:hypothetical protein
LELYVIVILVSTIAGFISGMPLGVYAGLYGRKPATALLASSTTTANTGFARSFIKI